MHQSPKLQASARDEVDRARLLDHVERVLIAHVDDRRANLDTAGLRARPRLESAMRCPPEVGRALSRLTGP
jgi:hypothetical protein